MLSFVYCKICIFFHLDESFFHFQCTLSTKTNIFLLLDQNSYFKNNNNFEYKSHIIDVDFVSIDNNYKLHLDVLKVNELIDFDHMIYIIFNQTEWIN